MYINRPLRRAMPVKPMLKMDPLPRLKKIDPMPVKKTITKYQSQDKPTLSR